MRYSDELIDEVREANDIVDVIGQYVRLTKKGANYFGLCPFHGEKTPSFSVSPRKQIYYCFGCGAGGNVITFLMNYENYSFTEALKVLAERANIELPENGPDNEDSGKKSLKAKLYEVNKAAAYFYYGVLHSPEGGLGYDYFTGKRRLSEKTITHFGLGFSPKARDALYRHLKEKGYTDDVIRESGLVTFSEKGMQDKFWNRVIFPIMDTNNRVIGFGGRVMGEAMPKYLNSPETLIFDKSSTLYGLNFAKKSKRKYMLLCEGYMDVIALHQAGFTNAVASLGTALNEKHARLLKRYTDNVVLTQDSDEAGTKAKLRAFPILHDAGLNVRILEIKDAKDPDELIRTKGPEAYEECISRAENAFLYMVEVMKREHDLSDPAERTTFYNDVSERLCMFNEGLERDNYTEAVSRKLMIDKDELKGMVDRRFSKKRNDRPAAYEKERSFTAPEEKKGEKNDSRILKYEKTLAAWLSERPELTDTVIKYIKAEDFAEGVLRDIITELSSGRPIKPADFLDKYKDDEAELSCAAEIFSGIGNDVSELGRADLEKGLTEAVRAIRISGIDREISESKNDLKKLSELIKEKNRLTGLKIFIEDEAVKKT